MVVPLSLPPQPAPVWLCRRLLQAYLHHPSVLRPWPSIRSGASAVFPSAFPLRLQMWFQTVRTSECGNLYRPSPTHPKWPTTKKGCRTRRPKQAQCSQKGSSHNTIGRLQETGFRAIKDIAQIKRVIDKSSICHTLDRWLNKIYLHERNLVFYLFHTTTTCLK